MQLETPCSLLQLQVVIAAVNICNLFCFVTSHKTKEGFLRKNIVAVSFFKTVLYTNILNTCTYRFH